MTISQLAAHLAHHFDHHKTGEESAWWLIAFIFCAVLNPRATFLVLGVVLSFTVLGWTS